MKRSDPLGQLWQQQATAQLDMAALVQRYRKLRRFQWLYLAADMGALGAIAALFAWVQPQLNTFGMAAFAVILVLATAFTGYVVWLRWSGLRTQTTDTYRYQQQLLAQLNTNIRLAKATTASLLPCTLLVLGFHLGHGWSKHLSIWQAVEQVGLAALLLLLILPPIGYITVRRQRRFAQEREQLLNLSDQNLKK